MDGDGVEVESVELGGITIWAGADPGKRKAKADSLRQAQGRLSPDVRPVRNDKFGLGSSERLADLEGMTPKELGELAEAEFLRRALGMGMAITKPWGESRAYDFIVDDEGRLCRVQVKAAFREGPQGGYSLRAYRSSKKCYTKKEIDALAGYAAPENAWYLFPVRVIRKVKSLKLFPGSKGRRSKFERWREAWGVVRGKVR
jgi:hypothetical protein